MSGRQDGDLAFGSLACMGRYTLTGMLTASGQQSPEGHPDLGRKHVYGERLPTLEQVRQSDQYNWQKVNAWAKAIRMNFSGFVNHELKTQSQRNVVNPSISAMIYMRN